MADPKQIEQELLDFLDKESSIRKSDRIVYLMAIIEKHFALDKINFMVDYSDIQELISSAKSKYATAKMPVKISHKEISNAETNYILVIDAFIGFLNKNKLLKRLVKFNYTD